MIILLEGSDCVGKSTLANACADVLNAAGRPVIRHKSGTPRHADALIEYLVPLHSHTGKTPLILDRHHLGELVYGPILRDGSRLTHAQAHYIELVLTRLGTASIHVSTSQSVHKERFDARGDDVVTWPQAAQAWLMFNQLRAEFTHYTTIHTDSFPLFRNVLDILKRMEIEQELHQDLPDTYIGPARPRVLLLGDKQGPTRPSRPELRWPFVPWRDTSGHWLFEAMLTVGIKPAWDVGLVNACDRGSEALSDLYKQLDAPSVVALGVNARNAATEAGLPLAAHISHPQYARRFHNKSQAEYGQRIKESMR